MTKHAKINNNKKSTKKLSEQCQKFKLIKFRLKIPTKRRQKTKRKFYVQAADSPAN